MDGHSNRAFLSLLIERRFKGFIIVSKCRQDSNILTYSLIADTKCMVAVSIVALIFDTGDPLYCYLFYCLAKVL